MKEEFKNIPNFNNKYSISNISNVKNNITNEILNQYTDKDGYKTIGLMQNNNKKMFKIHRLMLLTFIGEPPFKNAICRHLDGNPANNKIENLKWGTVSDNYEDRKRHRTDFSGERNPKSKLTDDDIHIVNYMIYMHCSDRLIAKRFNVNPECIYKIRHKITWKHIDDFIVPEQQISKKNDTLTNKERSRRIYRGIINRCYNKNNERYKDYGGRGITVCERWLDKNNGFENFFKDMGSRPGTKYQLHRIDNDENYCPENCRWVSPKQNSRNRRNTIYVNYMGNKRPLIEVAEITNIPYDTLWRRIRVLKMPIEKALIKEIK